MIEQMVKNNNNVVDEKIKQEIISEVKWAVDVSINLPNILLNSPDVSILDLVKFVLERKDANK